MYADDLCIFSPSVAGLRKLTDCCLKYGELFNITYNAKKSFCMVIDNKPQDMKIFHCLHLNKYPLPYTMKCKYQPNKKYAFFLCNISTKITLFQVYCAPMYTSSLWCKFKKI